MKKPQAYKAELTQATDTLFQTLSPYSSGLNLASQHTALVDTMLVEIFKQHATTAEQSDSVALIALGGYGRKELCPFSDIDLLILHNNQTAPPFVAPLVRFLWDTGLCLGCVVRSLSECKSILGQDIATDTAFIEARFLSGSSALSTRLLSRIVNSHIRRTGKTFSKIHQKNLASSIYSAQESIFRIEPDLKNGVATLRDCQRMLWSNYPACATDFSLTVVAKNALQSDLAASNFIAGYDFITLLRICLHTVCGHKQDILETSMQPELALLLGFGENGAGKLMERFYTIVRTLRFSLQLFLEVHPANKPVWEAVQKSIGSVKISEGFAISSGILFQTTVSYKICAPETIITLFLRALNNQATLSVSLVHSIEMCNENLTCDDYRNTSVAKSFLAIFRNENKIGPLLSQMHQSQTLCRIIPQFETLFCKVEYDSYHELTVDEHTLHAVSAVDYVHNDSETVMRECYDAFGKNNKATLRFALLFHDIGKSMKGDHSLHGVIIAEELCELLGIPKNESDIICFLVFNHLKLSDLSLLGEPSDSIITQTAHLVASQKTLALLYLLTVIDIRMVGKATWTGWKSFIFERIFHRVNESLTGDSQISLLPSPFYGSLLDEPVFNELAEQAHGNSLGIRIESYAGFDRIIVCGFDRIGFLADTIGCLTSEGYNILSANIHSKNNLAFDVFMVSVPQVPVIDSTKRLENLHRKWDLLKRGLTTAQTLVQARLTTYPTHKLRNVRKPKLPTIIFTNSEETKLTILRIETEDTAGLVYQICFALASLGINIAHAHLSTRVDRAYDTFHLSESRTLSLTQKESLHHIRETLVSQICLLHTNAQGYP